MKRPIPFGKYYLLERINVGGMAEVFRAKAYGVEGFERLVAVKRILPNIAEDEEFIEMFIDEAKIAVQLNHANIAQIFDLGKVDDSYFIALEYLHGKDLRAIFDRCVNLTQSMPIPQACFIVMKVCEGLDYAHNKRDASGEEMHLVHRDVSPQNILISYEGEVKLIDFGIAKAAGKASKTQAGILKGKFGYMSPEQVRGLPLDRRSDIFSVGIILYELLTGERLFLGESDFSTLEKVRNVEILPPSTYNRKVGEELEQIVLKALAKDVEDRYQNAIDIHDDLQAYMYTSGEFYSRKDLASWMKQTFPDEIREEAKKLEEYRDMSVPELGATPSFAERAVSQPGVVPPAPPPVPGGNGHSAAMSLPRSSATVDFPDEISAPSAGRMTWDDEEIETQIYDKPSQSSAELSIPDPLLDGGLDRGLGPPSEDLAVPAPLARTEALSHPALPPGATGPIMPSSSMPSVSMPPARRSVDLSGPSRMLRPGTSPVPGVLPTIPPQKRRWGRTTVFVSAVAAVLLLCGAAIYPFLVHGSNPGSLHRVLIPSDVEVYVDGKRRGQGTPLTVGNLKPGFYILSVRKKGYEAWGKTIEIRPNATSAVTAQLEALATASVELRTRPSGALAFLDGRRLTGVTPMRITQITPGRHRLEVRKTPGYHPWVHEFEIKPDENSRLQAKMLPLQVAVRIASTPPGTAYVVRDGQRERLGRTPINIKLNPKYSYGVVVDREGYAEWTGSVQFDGDAPVSIEAKLQKPEARPASAVEPPPARPPKPPRVAAKQPTPAVRPPKPPPRKPTLRPTKPEPRPAKPTLRPTKPEPVPVGLGVLQVNSKPWTRIAIDGKDTGLTTPQLAIRLPAGSHRVTLTNPKFSINETFTVLIRPDKPTRLVRKFSEK